MPAKTLKIDLHTHILPREWPNLKEKYGYGGFVQLKHCPERPKQADMLIDDKFFRRIDDNCYCAEARLRDCDRDGVDAQVLSENPKRFVGLGTLPMNAPELAVDELRRCV